jgi:hypothetical protein
MYMPTPTMVRFSLSASSYSTVLRHLKKQDIDERVRFYGFVECDKISTFLREFVGEDEVIDMNSYRYILENINDCLKNHAKNYKDTKSLKYFRPLFELRDELEFITSISWGVVGR